MRLALIRLALAIASPSGARSRLSVLIYHRVRSELDPLFPWEPDAAIFDRHLDVLTRLFNILPLGEAIDRLMSESLPERPACITFDDGYADNAAVALPILKRYGLPATFFVSTGYLDGGTMWNDTIIESLRGVRGPVLDLTGIGMRPFATETISERQSAIAEIIDRCKYKEHTERVECCNAIAERAGAVLPTDLMMTRDQVRWLVESGMDIGAHTSTHPVLKRVPMECARDEIAGGKDAIEAIIGRPVAVFAYPNGKPMIDYGSEHVAMVRSLGFKGAVTTAWGAATRGADVFQLPRFTPWDRSPIRFGARLVQNLRRPVDRVGA